MFGGLKKKLKNSVSKLTRKAEKKAEKKPKKPKKAAPKAKKPRKKKPGLKERIVKRVSEKEFSRKELDGFFSEELELDLLQNNVALEVADFLKKRLKDDLAEKSLKRRQAKKAIKKSFEESLTRIVSQGEVDLKKIMKNKPATFVFLGFNGSGKTTSIAKMARYLTDKKHKVVLAAGDTFRAASIEQLEVHGDKLGTKVVKHDYGADSAAVIFDARKYAKAKGVDVVLADTAGRSHANANLMNELKKVVKVNKPDLKILVVDSLTGNDAVDQAKAFDEAVGVDAVLMTKVDVNEKGGSILSVSWAIKKPILFIGVGQDYKDLERFDPKKFVKDLLE